MSIAPAVQWVVGVAEATWVTFVDMAPYLLLGLTFAGLLHVLFHKDFIVRHLGSNTSGSVVKAALLGVPLPLCSCGVIPTALSLRRSKASKGAVMSFLVSTPQTGIDSIIATYGMLGPVFAVFRPFAALLMGIGGGLLMRKAGQGDVPKQVESGSQAFECMVCDRTAAHTHSLPEKLWSMVRYAYGSFLDDISLQLLVGILISGFISYVVPEGFFASYVTNDLLGMLLVIVAGVPLYVCATASIPIAAALMLKGLSPGVAFVFLAVGPATNAATMTLVGNKLGRRFLVTYLATMILGAMAAGFALNATFGVIGDLPGVLDHLHEHGGAPAWWMMVFVYFFLGIMVLSLFRRFFPRVWARLMSVRRSELPRSAPLPGGADSRDYLVDGMTCSHCAAHVREALLSVPGVSNARVDLGAKTATVEGSAAPEAVCEAVREAGYEASGRE